MKKDLTKYYVEVTSSNLSAFKRLLRKAGHDVDNYDMNIFSDKCFIFIKNCFVHKTKEGVKGRRKISLKTLTNYIAYNNQVDKSFVEPKELRKLTEENTTLANGNKELLQKCVFLENEVKILQGTERKKDEVISIQNDMLEVKDLENETLKKELNAKSVALILVSFTLTIALIFIAQKL